MLLFLVALITTTPSAPGDGVDLTVHRSDIAAQLSGVEATRAVLHRLRQQSWQVCRRSNRHGAMAERGTRRCSQAMLDQLVIRLDLPCLDAVHRGLSLSRQASSCHSEARIANTQP